MTAQLDIKEGLQRALHVTIPVIEWHTKTAELLTKRAKSAKIQGFRPGKAPLDVVKKHYGASVAEEALDAIVSKHLFAGCQENNVTPITRPSIETLKAEADQDIEFTATFEVEPTIEAIEFAGVPLEKIVSEVTTADIENVLTNLQARFATFTESDQAAALKHRLTFDFEGFVDGVAFEGGKAEKFQLVLGEGRMIPGFEEGLLGLTAGAEKRIHVTFPAEYQADLAGKAAEFAINVHHVEVPVLAELTEDFCRSLGVVDGQIDTLKKEIRLTLERELTKTLRNKQREQAFDKLLEINALEVPAAEVHDEVHHLMEKAQERFKEMAKQQTGSVPKELPKFPHGMFEAEALKRVKTGYLVRALIRLANLDITDADVRTLAEELAGPYETPAEVVRYHLDNVDRHNQLKALALEYKVVQHLFDLATVTEKPILYAELMQANA